MIVVVMIVDKIIIVFALQKILVDSDFDAHLYKSRKLPECKNLHYLVF